jgi:hypothetical protein
VYVSPAEHVAPSNVRAIRVVANSPVHSPGTRSPGPGGHITTDFRSQSSISGRGIPNLARFLKVPVMVALWVQRCLKTHGFPSHVSTIMLAPSC